MKEQLFNRLSIDTIIFEDSLYTTKFFFMRLLSIWCNRQISSLVLLWCDVVQFNVHERLSLCRKQGIRCDTLTFHLGIRTEQQSNFYFSKTAKTI
jgi:hypothetical protein